MHLLKTTNTPILLVRIAAGLIFLSKGLALNLSPDLWWWQSFNRQKNNSRLNNIPWNKNQIKPPKKRIYKEEPL